MTAAVAALIPAAGSGERLGRGPKAFVEVGGRTLLAWSAAALRPHVAALVVAVPAGEVARAEALVPDARVVLGGPSRQATVSLLLAATDAERVLVHDVARPFLPGGVVEGVLAAVASVGAATAALPVADTLVRADDGAQVDRAALRAVQTPQGFERALLLEAHRRADPAAPATDDAALIRRLGREVALVRGSAWLRKITTSDDLAVAEALAATWRERWPG